MSIIRLIELAISIIGMLGNWNNSDVSLISSLSLFARRLKNIRATASFHVD